MPGLNLVKRARSSICTHQAQNWSKHWRKWVFKIQISEKCGPPVCLLGAHTFGARLGKCSSNMVPNDLPISYLNSKNSKSYESPHFTFKKWRTFLNGVIYLRGILCKKCTFFLGGIIRPRCNQLKNMFKNVFRAIPSTYRLKSVSDLCFQHLLLKNNICC